MELKERMVRRALVDVFEDPITEKRLEGRARLIRKVDDEEFGMERWVVQFVGEVGEPHVVRRIAVLE